MGMTDDYSVEEFTADIPVEDYVARYRDADKFGALCRQCPAYGMSWACPPFDFDTGSVLRRYSGAHLVAVKITPVHRGIAVDRAQSVLRPEREHLESRLLEMERRYGGRAFSFVGNCLHCPEGECARRHNQPCRYPDKVRPSLEAFGFDIGRTLADLFGIRLLWGHDGLLPEYLVIVGGFFHNGMRSGSDFDL